MMQRLFPALGIGTNDHAFRLRLQAVLYGILVLILIVLPAFKPAYAEDKTVRECREVFRKHYESMEKELPKVMKEAKVTEEQQQKLTTIRRDAMARIEPISSMLFQKQKEIIQAIFSPQVDSEAVRCLGNEISELRAKIVTIKVDALLQSKCILTPEQKAAFAAFHGRKLSELQSKHPECIPYFSPEYFD